MTIETLHFKIDVPNNPQKTRARWYARVNDEPKFLIGQTVGYKDGDGPHRGLYQTRVMNEIPALYFDRKKAEAYLGLWAHFIWPTVIAESGTGHHLILNSYDRARFTFGFYQLAAHRPRDNLILLFRELVQLPKARAYFPDLFLKSGRLHRQVGSKSYSLEKVSTVHRPNGKVEKQLVSFMTYLNPDSLKANKEEALTAAKLMHWLVNDADAVRVCEQVAISILKRKVQRYAAAYKLIGRDPRLAIWIADIRHQGRGGKSKIKKALQAPTLKEQLRQLSKVDIYTTDSPKGRYLSRRKSVQESIDQLMKEGVFDDVVLGDSKLPIA